MTHTIKHKESGRNYEYRRCLGCGECWDATPQTTNQCQVCRSKQSLYMSEWISDRIMKNDK